MSLTTWKINGIELELDLSDADVLEKYETAFENMAKNEKNISKDGKASERIRAACDMFKKLFIGLFGESATADIFKDVPTSILRYEEIYDSFLEFASKQMQETTKIRNERYNKYIPNRQTRRAKKK